jgi:hypothetical protein
MRDRLSAHLRANLVAYAALFLSLGGGSVAWAALDANSVGSKQIKDDQVKSADVRDDISNAGGLQAADLGSDSVGTSEVVSHSLTGTDIDESTLNGGNATTVNSISVTHLQYRHDAGGLASQLNMGDFGLIVSCAADGDITVSVINASGVNGALVAASTVTGSGATYAANDALPTANTLVISAADDAAVTQFFVAGADAGSQQPFGVFASGSFTTQEYPAGGGLGRTDNRCVLEGSATFDG